LPSSSKNTSLWNQRFGINTCPHRKQNSHTQKNPCKLTFYIFSPISS
jgi:hypothetical protein